MAAIDKIDLKKNLGPLYAPPSKAPVLVTIPPLLRFSITGEGDPNTSAAWAQAMDALYSLSYTLKFMRKKRGQTPDYGVMPLEGLWWTPDMADFRTASKDQWHWTALIVQPDFITQAEVDEARAEARRKKDLPALDLVRFESFEEGLCAQIMHIGPYAAEEPTVRRLHDFIAAQGLALHGRHHEIYLSDPARTAPEKMKTIVRQPAARA